MAQYCVFCEQTFISFTHLRNHTCNIDKPLQERFSPDNQKTSPYFQSDEEKDNWIEQLFKLAETASLERKLIEDTEMAENLVETKTKYEYTIEMNEDIDSEMIENNPELNKVLVESKETFVVQKTPEKSDEGKSDFVYVLEDKASVINTVAIPAVLDLSGSNKRKRKSNVLNELPSLEESKLVIDEQEVGDKYDENDSEEIQPNKIHVSDSMVSDRNSDGKMSPDSGFGNLNGDMSDDCVLDFSMAKLDTKPSSPEVIHSKVCGVIDFSTPKMKSETVSSKSDLSTSVSPSGLQTFSSPKIAFNTPPVPASSSVISSGPSRKNRRKRSIPVRCERNEEISDITDIIQDYAVEPELVHKTVKSEENVKSEHSAYNVKSSVEQNLHVPVDLTPKPVTKPLTLPCTSREASMPSPVDLSARKSPEMVRPMVKAEPVTPVDLSAASVKKNTTKASPIMPGSNFPGLLGGNPYDPLQMRQMFEMMYRMSPNHNIVQAQLMQFHALLQNSMMNNRLAQMNNLNTMKSVGAVQNDKNDNIIKTENDSSNDSVEQELRKYSMNFMQKNGILNNAFTPPVISPMMAGQVFTPSPVSSFRGKPGRRKTKDPLFTPESSPASPKLESKLPPIDLDSNSSPDQVIDTLQKFFPIMSNTDSTTPMDDSIARFFVKDNDQIQVIVDSLLNVGVLDLHEQEIHGTEPVYKYICRVCNQTFFHVEHLTKHVKKQHIVKKYQCSECERSFHDAGNYRQHMRVHDDNDIPYACDICNRKFRHKCTLKVHMRIHTGEKPFKCDVCGATFKISSGLQTHMRKHTGETPYACEFCDLRFKCQSNLKQHLFQHTQVRPFPCDICGKTYSRKSIRDAHLLTHAKEYIKNGITDISQVPVAGNLSQVPMLGDISKVPMTVGGME